MIYNHVILALCMTHISRPKQEIESMYRKHPFHLYTVNIYPLRASCKTRCNLGHFVSLRHQSLHISMQHNFCTTCFGVLHILSRQDKYPLRIHTVSINKVICLRFEVIFAQRFKCISQKASNQGARGGFGIGKEHHFYAEWRELLLQSRPFLCSFPVTSLEHTMKL